MPRLLAPSRPVRRALERGAQLADAMSDAAAARAYRSTAREIAAALTSHLSVDEEGVAREGVGRENVDEEGVAGSAYLSEEQRSHHPPISRRTPTHRWVDSAVILALNMGFDDPHPVYVPTSAHVASTVRVYMRAFCAEYPVNTRGLGGAAAAVAAETTAAAATTATASAAADVGDVAAGAPDGRSGGRRQSEERLPGVLFGRYPGDVYHGGNPWILTTAALAQLLYRVGHAAMHSPTTQSATRAQSAARGRRVAAGRAASHDQLGSMPADVMRVWAATLNAPTLATPLPAAGVASIFSRAGDSVLARIASHVRRSPADRPPSVTGDGVRADAETILYEQIDEHSGRQTAARSLTWSYAEVLNALHWRERLRDALALGTSQNSSVQI